SEALAVAQNQSIATRNRWLVEGTSNSMPRAVFNDPNKNTRASDRYVQDGSYLRLKNVTLGYTLPEKIIEKVHLQKARLYASVQNLLTFTDYTGFDPEVPANGIDFNVYPVTRTVSFGVNLSF
ncbi:MAG: SusC/RagA family TonB-linked outer membrane protein, partial [Fulvivirga sp.]